MIALVVTIIVLLILAGVAINLTIGQNGIFTRAQDAVNKYEQASLNEQNELKSAEEIMDELMNGNKPKEGTLLAMYYKAIEDNCTNADGSCDRADHLHVGDYVDFKNPSTGSATASASQTGHSSDQYYTISQDKNQLNWRVLGYDKETGGIKLIAGTPLMSEYPSGYLTMYGAQAYVTGYLVPEQISNDLYGKEPYVKKARSVKIEDINELVGINGADDIKEYNALPVMNEGMLQYGENYNVYGYTPESYLASEAQKDISDTVSGYAYIVSPEEIPEIPAKYKIMNNQRIYNMLFNDTELGTGGAYWLSSRGVAAYPGLARFGPGAVYTDEGVSLAGSYGGTFNSNGGEYGYDVAVRPVVCLESDVLEAEVPKIADKTENPWGGTGGGSGEPE